MESRVRVRVLRLTQPSTLRGTENEYQPKGRDVLRLGSKGRHGVICRCKTV